MKYCILFLIILLPLYLYSFDELEYMKKRGVSDKKAILIKESVDEWFHLVSDVFNKEIIYILIYKESSFNEKAVSPTGDYGLFQVNKDTYTHLLEIKEFKINRWNVILTVRYNIIVGLVILKEKIRSVNIYMSPISKKEVMLMTLIAYNMGEGNLVKNYPHIKDDLYEYDYIKHLKIKDS